MTAQLRLSLRRCLMHRAVVGGGWLLRWWSMHQWAVRSRFERRDVRHAAQRYSASQHWTLSEHDECEQCNQQTESG
jgi:hypothetical protein